MLVGEDARRQRDVLPGGAGVPCDSHEGDVFRRLDRAETPPTLSEIFGADHVTIVLSAEGTPLATEWAAFAATWAAGGKDVKVLRETEIETLPSGRATWIVGSGSRFGADILVDPHGNGSPCCVRAPHQSRHEARL